MIGLAVGPELMPQFFAPETRWPAPVQELGDPQAPGFTVPDVDVLVTSWGMPPLDAAVLAGAPALRLVAHTGSAIDGFITPDVFARGIAVTQAGTGMARSVAEAALAMTLALLHRIPESAQALRPGGSWPPGNATAGRHEILGSTIGVIGASRIGRCYIELVGLLGAEVLVSDPTVSAVAGARVVPLPELLAASRIVSLHAPVLPETHHLLGAAELALMPDGSGLVNTARSWLVVEDALVAELASGRLNAALDVFDVEPVPAEHPLRALPNVLLTPHRAAATFEGRRRQGAIVVAEVERFLREEPLEHAV